jgi:zinc protease
MMPHRPLPLRVRPLVAILLTALAAALPAGVRAAAPPQTASGAPVPGVRLPLADSMRLDPAVLAGTLPNGLRYYIRHNARPEARVALRLAVAAGSTAEADDQRGLAHFSEHMNFNGSAHFKPEELVAYLEAIGLRFAADANAYTSFDETVYKLDVPTDRDTLLDRGLLALSDFAGGATLSDSEFAKERGVVLEEWRLGRGAGERIQR